MIKPNAAPSRASKGHGESVDWRARSCMGFVMTVTQVSGYLVLFELVRCRIDVAMKDEEEKVEETRALLTEKPFSD